MTKSGIKKSKSAPDLPTYKPADVPVGQLVLDTENQRLAPQGEHGTPTQVEIGGPQWSEAAVDERAYSLVARLYRGYTVLKQAEKQAGFARADLWKQKFYFSHLYTALDQPEFQNFLGLKPDAPPVENPVTKAKLGALEEFMMWLYGKKS